MSDKEQLLEKINSMMGWKIPAHRFKIVTDTSEWMNIHRGHIISLNGKNFLVRGNMNEPRFGIDDQPKYWVFSAIELETGKEKIIKTVFYEEFISHIGIFKIRCYRSPEKESQILESVRGDDRFMQGYTIYDQKENNVRIIDYIKGVKLFHYIPNIPKTHKNYFYEDLPELLHKILSSIEAIRDLHKRGFCHGDIRNDHIIIESNTRIFRWIDFDLKQDVTDFDMWSVGNIICYAVAKGILTFDAALKSKQFSNEIKNSLDASDSSAFYEYRIMNLKKIYDYIPERLSDILQHFTIRPKAFFRDIDELLEKYQEMLIKEF